MLLTQRETLSSMLLSGEVLGTHGAAFVDRAPMKDASPRKTRTLSQNGVAHLSPVSEMPNPELWFETLLARQKERRSNELF